MYEEFYQLELDNIFEEFNKDYINFESLITSVLHGLKNNKNNNITIETRIKILQSFSNKNPSITYSDMIAKHLFNILKYKSTYPNITNIVSETKELILYLYTNENNYDTDSLINHIISLTLQSYEDIVSESPSIDINYIYNEVQLEAVLGYLVILTYKIEANSSGFILDNSNKSSLIDSSISYMYNLCNYVNNQSKYFNTLSAISNKYVKYDRKISRYKSHLSLNKRILLKWLNIIDIDFNINNIDQWRIHYNSCSLIGNDVNNKLKILPISECFKIYSVSNAFIENVAYFNIDISQESIAIPFFNSFWICVLNVLNTYDNNFNKSIDTLKNINTVIIKHSIHELVLKTFHSDDFKNYQSSFKVKYHNIVFSLLDNLIKSISEIVKYTKSLTQEIDFIETNNYVIHFEFMKQMFSELNYILDVYKILDFEPSHLVMIAEPVFRLFCDQDFKNILHKESHKYSYEIGVYYLWDKYVNLLESVPNLFINLIEKLVQSDFNYKNLNKVCFARISRNFIKLFNKYYSCKDDIINLSDKFGDPITYELIKDPLILPTTKQFVDKSVIYQILKTNPINPFNGVSLTIEELEEYNKQEDVQSKVSEFMINLNSEMEKILAYKK